MDIQINEGVYKQLIKVAQQQDMKNINDVLDYLLFVESDL